MLLSAVLCRSAAPCRAVLTTCSACARTRAAPNRSFEAPAEEIGALFDSMDADHSGTLEYVARAARGISLDALQKEAIPASRTHPREACTRALARWRSPEPRHRLGTQSGCVRKLAPMRWIRMVPCGGSRLAPMFFF